MKYFMTTSAISISVLASLFFALQHRGQAQEPTNTSAKNLHIEERTTNNSSIEVQSPSARKSEGVRTLIGDRYMDCAITADRSGITCTEEGKNENSHWKVEVNYKGFYSPSFPIN